MSLNSNAISQSPKKITLKKQVALVTGYDYSDGEIFTLLDGVITRDDWDSIEGNKNAMVKKYDWHGNNKWQIKLPEPTANGWKIVKSKTEYEFSKNAISKLSISPAGDFIALIVPSPTGLKVYKWHDGYQQKSIDIPFTVKYRKFTDDEVNYWIEAFDNGNVWVQYSDKINRLYNVDGRLLVNRKYPVLTKHEIKNIYKVTPDRQSRYFTDSQGMPDDRKEYLYDIYGRVKVMAEFGHIVRISVGAGCCTTSMDKFTRVYHLRDKKYWDYKHPEDYTYPWSVSDNGKWLLCETKITKSSYSDSVDRLPADKHKLWGEKAELRVIESPGKIRAFLPIRMKGENQYLDLTNSITINPIISPDGHVILLKVFDEKKRDYYLKWYAW